MTNNLLASFLEKLAERDTAANTANTERAENILAGGAAAGLGGVAIANSKKHILGYSTVYHGTNSAAAKENILQKGIRKSFAGTNVAANDMRAGAVAKEHIDGRIFTTTIKPYAERYTAEGFLNMPNKNNIVKAHVPYRGANRLPKDQIFVDMADDVNKSPIDRLLATATQKLTKVYKHSIPSRFIEGSENYKGKAQFANINNLKRYLNQEGGKLRFGKGLATAALGIGAVGYGVDKMTDKVAGTYMEDTGVALGTRSVNLKRMVSPSTGKIAPMISKSSIREPDPITFKEKMQTVGKGAVGALVGGALGSAIGKGNGRAALTGAITGSLGGVAAGLEKIRERKTNERDIQTSYNTAADARVGELVSYINRQVPKLEKEVDKA